MSMGIYYSCCDLIYQYAENQPLRNPSFYIYVTTLLQKPKLQTIMPEAVGNE